MFSESFGCHFLHLQHFELSAVSSSSLSLLSSSLSLTWKADGPGCGSVNMVFVLWIAWSADLMLLSVSNVVNFTFCVDFLAVIHLFSPDFLFEALLFSHFL